MKDIKLIQEFFSKPLEENTFKTGDKVTYLGHPAVVTATKEYNGRDFVSVSYDKGTGKTSAPMILATSGDVKAVNEGSIEYSRFLVSLQTLIGDIAPNAWGNKSQINSASMKRIHNSLKKRYGADYAKYNNLLKTQSGQFGNWYLKEPIDDKLSKSVNEMDMNDPVMMKMRAAKNKKSDFGKAYGDAVKVAYGGDKDAKKIAFLKKERAQLMRDMEQEAEPEGGPIADEYGSKLNRIDAAIAKLSGRKEMTYDQAIAEGEGKMPTQDQVDKFFALTQNETHYLNSKPVAGQEATFNLMKVEPWDEYDLSNWNSLVRKAKEKKSKFKKHGEMSGFDMRGIDEAQSRVSMPRFVKDKRHPNFLNVYIDYDLGPGGVLIALGKETMTGQIRRESAAEAMRLAGDVARDLEAEYNVEDIDVQDLENGVVQVFAVSDDFINMDPNMLGEIKKSVVEKVISQIKEAKPGLWANIRAKKARGEKPSHGNSKAHKSAVKSGKKINKLKEEIEDNGVEEKSFDAELMAAANGIAATLGKELKSKQGNKKQLDEAVVTSIIAAVLTGNALIGFISKMSKKLAKKFNWKKGEDFADKVNKWAHDNEVAFQKPIKRILKFFIKDETKLEATTKGIYALIIISMAASYGAEAVSSLSNASWFKAAIASLKGIAKGDEAIATAYPVIKSFIA